MAFMNQERKSTIAAALKLVAPPGWKYTLSVRNNSTIVFTLTQAPVDLIGHVNGVMESNHSLSSPHDLSTANIQVNEYHLDTQFQGPVLKVFEGIYAALNLGNHDNSDIQSDYFDVGWYVDVRIGKYDAPFLDTVPAPPPPLLPSQVIEIAYPDADVDVEGPPTAYLPSLEEVKPPRLTLKSVPAVLYEKYRIGDYLSMNSTERSLATRAAFKHFLKLVDSLGLEALIKAEASKAAMSAPAPF